MREQLLKLVSKWRDEADAMERDWGRVAPMQTNIGRDALRLCAAELEELLQKETKLLPEGH